MKKTLKIFLLMIVFLSMAVLSVCAESYDLYYDGGDSDFVVFGNLENKKAGQVVTIKVESQGVLLYLRQTETNGNGEYNFIFNVPQYGEAEVIVSSNEGAVSGTIYKSTLNEVSEALSRLNSSESEEKIITDVEKNMNKILQVDLDEFNILKQSGVLTEYLSKKNFDSLAEFSEMYRQGTFFVKLATCTTVDDTYSLIAQYDAFSMLGDYNAAKILSEYNENNKKEMLTGVNGKRFTDDKDFQNAILDEVILNELESAATDNEKWNVLLENNDYLKIDIEKYEKTNEFNEFKKQLFESSITSVDSLKEKMEDIYGDVEDEKKGNGGSGGGGKSSTVSASASLVPEVQKPETLGFNDINNHEWAKSAILTLAADGIIAGRGDGIFAPDDYVTRAEFTKIIIGAFGLLDLDASADFGDVEKGHWSYAYIASALKNGIINGVSENSFNPNGRITRQDMATICQRVLETMKIKYEMGDALQFADEAEIADYAKKAVETLSCVGVINGKGDNKFAPKDFATRAEAAKIIYTLRLMK